MQDLVKQALNKLMLQTNMFGKLAFNDKLMPLSRVSNILGSTYQDSEPMRFGPMGAMLLGSMPGMPEWLSAGLNTYAGATQLKPAVSNAFGQMRELLVPSARSFAHNIDLSQLVQPRK